MVNRGLWSDFLSAFTIVNGNYIPRLRDIDIQKQLTFRGFIPLEDYRKYNPKKYCYIMSNKSINGSVYIYPARYTHNYKLLKKGIPDIHQAFSKIALMGYTKIQYSTNNK